MSGLGKKRKEALLLPGNEWRDNECEHRMQEPKTRRGDAHCKIELALMFIDMDTCICDGLLLLFFFFFSPDSSFPPDRQHWQSPFVSSPTHSSPSSASFVPASPSPHSLPDTEPHRRRKRCCLRSTDRMEQKVGRSVQEAAGVGRESERGITLRTALDRFLLVVQSSLPVKERRVRGEEERPGDTQGLTAAAAAAAAAVVVGEGAPKTKKKPNFQDRECVCVCVCASNPSGAWQSRPFLTLMHASGCRSLPGSTSNAAPRISCRQSLSEH